MRSSWPLLLAVLGLACGGSSGDVISTEDGGLPLFPPQPADCATGPNYTSCACQPGTAVACYTGPEATRGVGGCRDGIQTCNAPANGGFAFGPCQGEVVPTAADSCTVTPPSPHDAGPPPGSDTGPMVNQCGDQSPDCCVADPNGCTLSSTPASGDPCSGWSCPNGGTVEWSCPPPCPVDAGTADGGNCSQGALDAFVAANDSCTTNQDCVPVCMLGASCDTAAVNQAGAAQFPVTFAGCMFPGCALACFPGTCVSGTCQ
jgi:hypothetical protein